MTELSEVHAPVGLSDAVNNYDVGVSEATGVLELADSIEESNLLEGS